jgi:hypothetical protein
VFVQQIWVERMLEPNRWRLWPDRWQRRKGLPEPGKRRVSLGGGTKQAYGEGPAGLARQMMLVPLVRWHQLREVTQTRRQCSLQVASRVPLIPA